MTDSGPSSEEEMMDSEPAANCVGTVGPASAVDRLRDLSDGLLHDILSFLPAPQVVQTCVLSRRWRGLWRSTPYVHIDECHFGISTRISRGVLEERWGSFEDFTTNLLMFHDSMSSLDEFWFSSHLYNRSHVDWWIRRGIEYCPAVLRIQIYSIAGHGRFRLPPVAGSSLRRLKTMRLQNVDLDRHFTELICSACPVLEDLQLDCCKLCDSYPQGITSSSLNKLILGCCDNNTSHALVITAPSLVYLSVEYGCYQTGLSLCKMDSLVEASIHIIENRTLSRKNQQELLCSLFNVTNLELVGFETQVMMLSEKSDLFPIFRYMQTLHLERCFLDESDLDDKLEALGSFHHDAPCLEKLTLDCCMVILSHEIVILLAYLTWSYFCQKFMSFPDYEWDIDRKSITLKWQDKETFQCPKLKLIAVIYEHDHDHQLIELLWSLGRRLPDASIKLTKNERTG